MISIFCMDSLRFGTWKDFSLGWWNALVSAWFLASAILKVWHCGSNFVLVCAIVHEKSRTDIRESWPSCPWQYFRSFDRGIVILSVFMAPDHVVLPASRNKSHRKLLTCFSGRGALGLSFREHKRRNGQILSVQLWRHYFINRGSRPRYFWSSRLQPRRQLSVVQFARWISQIPLRLIISISTDYIPPLLTKYGFYNAVKCFSMNK